MSRRLLSFLTFSIFSLFNFSLYSQNYNIDYFGVMTNQVDSNMSKMTSDLYYSQLCEISSFNVSDKRIDDSLQEIPDNKDFSTTALAFYAVINKKEDSSKWTATINIVDKNTDSRYSQTKEYDSYYKILMEPKSVLQESIKNLIKNGSSSSSEQSSALADLFNEQNEISESTEFLSGTWEGEASVDKIVIMRGGRGFVVFTNGASMNISVELKNHKILISQKGKSNASFFPELSRQVALKSAINAPLITWEFKLLNNDCLSGIKTTLIEDGDSAVPGTVNVIWKRKL